MTLSAQDVTVAMGGSKLLNSVTTAYRPGELTVILGANGAGKSTLLRCCAGLQIPSFGEIKLGVHSPFEMEPLSLARIRAYLPQGHELGFPFTVYDVVMMGRSPHFGDDGAGSDHQAVLAALEICDLTDISSQQYTTLSGGEKQRTHIARVLAQLRTENNMEQKYLLLDEPTNSLDIRHQQVLLEHLRSLVKQGACVIAVLHDINLAAQYADRIELMQGGNIYATGSPAGTLSRENIAHVFGIRSIQLNHPETGVPVIVTQPGHP